MEIPELNELKYKNVKQYLKNNYIDFFNYLNDIYPDTITFPEKVYWYYNNINFNPVCPVCGAPLKFKTLFVGYPKTCSMKCSRKTEEYQEKIKQTNLKRYGVENAFESKLIQEKIKRTNLKKYGVEHPSQNEYIKEKTRQTNLKKYGVTCTVHNKDIQAKVINTNLKRYGVENAFESKLIQEKIKRTNLKKYGVEHPSQNEYIKEKTKLSYLNQFSKKHNDIISVTYNKGQNNTIYTCACTNKNCNKCVDKVFNIDSLHYWVRKNNNVELCTTLLPITSNICKLKNTSIELFVHNILKKYNIKYITNIRTIIPPKELDIYIPSKKIAIECNGIFWHSDLRKEKNYHYDKYKKCLEQGIQLLTIWEDQIINNPDIVESIILSKLGIYEQRIGARQCIVKEVDINEAREFLQNNHIQGYSTSRIKIGLYYKEELISLMTFAHKKSGIGKYETNQWELSRFCTKIKTQVIGGANKLFKYFIKHYNPESIISFASHDISNGNLYKKLNFTLNTSSKYSYWYIDPKTYTRYHRLNFTKKKLIKLGYSDQLTESEIMKSKGYLNIFDSGQDKYVYINKIKSH